MIHHIHTSHIPRPRITGQPFGGFELGEREIELRRKNEALETRQAEVLKRTEELKRQKEEQQRSIPAGSRPASTRLDRMLANAADSALRFSAEEPLAGVHSASSSAASSPHHGGRPASAAVQHAGAQRTAHTQQRSPAASARPVSSRPAATVQQLQTQQVQPPQSNSDQLSELDMEADMLGPRMGAEARIRFQAARLKVMQEEIVKLVAELNEKDKAGDTLAASLKAAEEESKRLARRLQEAEASNDKLKRAAAEAISRATTLEAETTTARKEADAQEKARKQLEAEKRGRDVRLNRALEEADRLRAQLKDQKEAVVGGSDALKSECARLEAEVKKLARQKTEILNAFKKQMKLVDILKRQKMHIEAARLLAFTEEEFTKALEIQV